MINIDTDLIKIKLEKTKRIAIIAHDGKKSVLVEWVKRNREILSKHFLCGTGTTGKLVAAHTGLPVKTFNSGPLGGDLQIGSRIAEGEIDLVIFLWDPLKAQPHDPDVRALLRIAAVYDIPIANNLATADFLIHSSLMSEEYEVEIKDYHETLNDSAEKYMP